MDRARVRLLKISAAYTPPPPPGFISPVMWGEETQVRDRFESAGIAPDDIACERATWTFRLEGPPRDLLAIFRDYYGPTMNAFEAATKAGKKAQLQQELEALFEAQNIGGSATEIPATYLKVTALKR